MSYATHTAHPIRVATHRPMLWTISETVLVRRPQISVADWSVSDADLFAPASYDELIAVFVRRAAELGISHASLDDLAGLADGFVSKVFGPSKVKRLGPMSLFALLPALGLKITLVEDPDALRRFGGRARRRQWRQARMGNLAQRAGARMMQRALRHLAKFSWNEAQRVVAQARAVAAAEAAQKAAIAAEKAAKANSNGSRHNGKAAPATEPKVKRPASPAAGFDAAMVDELEEIAEASSIRVTREAGERRGAKRGRVSAPFPSPMDQHAINRRTQARLLSKHAKPVTVAR